MSRGSYMPDRDVVLDAMLKMECYTGDMRCISNLLYTCVRQIMTNGTYQNTMCCRKRQEVPSGKLSKTMMLGLGAAISSR